ncbi:MAG TPA: hypothetical protein VNM38_04435 [Solirubrobacterales bacterium]|nr:hypothetical protein [Solirubrobacterales bacterium]
MRGVRVRWAGIWKVAAVVAALLLSLQALPALLRPPEPPPLGADVGLPRVVPAPEEPPPPEPPSRRRRLEKHRKRAKGAEGLAAVDVISSRPRPKPPHRHRRRPRFKPAPEQPPPPAAPPEQVPYEPPPAPGPPPVPAPPPAPAGDGSEEFAPR